MAMKIKALLSLNIPYFIGVGACYLVDPAICLQPA